MNVRDAALFHFSHRVADNSTCVSVRVSSSANASVSVTSSRV